MTLSSTLRALLEMQARDNGFDRELPPEGEWLAFASTKAPLKIWLSALGDGLPMVALSQLNVAMALEGHGTELTNPKPAGAVAARMVKDFESLHHLLRRAFQLSRSLPDEPLLAFKAKTAGLPRSTEVERLVVQRIGQDIFREGLLEYFDGRCAVTDLGVRDLLRASHIKPWASCDTDAERLDVHNGVLLAPNLDLLFDLGFITFEEDGRVRFSPTLPLEERGRLGVTDQMRAARIDQEHARYLAWHHQHRFRAG